MYILKIALFLIEVVWDINVSRNNSSETIGADWRIIACKNCKKFQTNCPYSLSHINNNFRYWNKLLKTRKSLWEIKMIFTHTAGKIGIKTLVSVQVIEDAGMNELSLTHSSYSSQWNNTVIFLFQILVFNTSAGRSVVFMVSYFHPLTQDQAPPVVWNLQSSPLCPGPACSRLDSNSVSPVYLIQPQTKGMVHTLSSVLVQ